MRKIVKSGLQVSRLEFYPKLQIESMPITNILHLAKDNRKLKAAIFRAEAKSEEALKRRAAGRDSSHIFKIHPDFHNSEDVQSES